jgi:tetratricopeptide (TPR) repeat protein
VLPGPGDRVECFELELVAGSGGFGTVFRARDLRDGKPVALKVAKVPDAAARARFLREANLLSSLRHPGIVRYVGHGALSSDELWLAMEWLEGNDLAERLKRAPLTVGESVALVRRVADALGPAHQRGILHRDLKPGNVFLENDDLEQVRVLDFGLARSRFQDGLVTAPGTVLGTLAYMSPEQSGGRADLDARTDVWGLGVLLYRLLTGHVPFPGPGLATMFSQIQHVPPVPPSSANPAVPPELDALVLRLLAKDRVARPPNAFAVAAELDWLSQSAGIDTPASLREPAALGARELRLASVVLVAPPAASADPDDQPTGIYDPARRTRVAEAVLPYGGHLDELAPGTWVVTIFRAGLAKEHAARAARCALAIRAVLPDASIAVATGRDVPDARGLVRQAIERAQQRLEGPTRAPRIALDALTASLLDPRFERPADAPQELAGMREVEEIRPTLLGRPSPFVGRERELGALLAAFEACVETRTARATLVTGPAGIGKSRLREELVAQISARSPGTTVWLAQCDELAAGATFAIVASLVRRESGIASSDPPDDARAKLRAYVGDRAQGPDAERIAEFVGEAIGLRFPAAGRPQLQAARADPVIMGDQLRRAFLDLAASRCDTLPLAIVVDDAQFGDLPSLSLLEVALRSLAHRPLFVVAFARPEVRDVFPHLLGEGVVEGVHALELAPLPRERAAELVALALTRPTPEATVDRVVALAEGNPFCLEELVRWLDRGEDVTLPEGVLAAVQGRLERLDPALRRVLRAASIFGRRFQRAGLAEVLGGARAAAKLDRRLALLVRHELIEPIRTAVPDGQPYAFRNALVREASYAALTVDDRRLGHRLAGEWLERGAGAAAPDPRAVAEHFERGGAPLRAVPWHRRAAEQALDGNDFEGAIARARAGVTAGAEGEELAALCLVEAEAHDCRGELEDALACARTAMVDFPAGSRRYFDAAGLAGELALALGRTHHLDEIVASFRAIRALPAEEAHPGARAIAASRLGAQLLHAGRREQADRFFEEAERGAAHVSPGDFRGLARLHRGRAAHATFDGDVGACLAHELAAAEVYAKAGDTRRLATQRIHVGYAQAQLGDFAGAERTLREALFGTRQLGLSAMAAAAEQNLGFVLGRLGRADEARAMLEAAIAAYVAQKDVRMEGGTRAYLADVLARAGDLEGAEREARVADAELAIAPPMRGVSLAALAGVLLARGNLAEARTVAEQMRAILEQAGGVLEEGEAALRLGRAEVLWAAGDRARAAHEVLDARDRLQARAERISDPGARQSFLGAVPEHARTIEWAEKLPRS